MKNEHIENNKWQIFYAELKLKWKTNSLFNVAFMENDKLRCYNVPLTAACTIVTNVQSKYCSFELVLEALLHIKPQ